MRQYIQLHGEWRERAEEDGTGLSSTQCCGSHGCTATANRFGTHAYEAMLSDSLSGVCQMIGKLNPRIYVRTR